MSKISALGNHKRRVTSLWERIPAASVLAKRYKAILWACVVEPEKLSAPFYPATSPKSECTGDNILFQWNPIQLERNDGTFIDINALQPEELKLLESIRLKTYKVCQGHLLERLANDLLGKEGK